MSEADMELETKLIERAVQEREKLLQEAKARAATILQKAENEVERIKRDTERQVVNIVGSELRAVSDRIVGQAELEGRETLMDARKNLLDSIFEEARERLNEVAQGNAETDYHKILKKLISEAVTAIGEDEFMIRANKEDLEYLRKNLSDMDFGITGIDFRFAEEAVDTMGGVIVENRDGTKIYRNTLESRLMTVRQEHEAEIAQTLEVI